MVDITGLKSGRLRVISYAFTKNGRSYWKVFCFCGNTRLVRQDHLKRGEIKSCGCLLREALHRGHKWPQHDYSIALRNSVLAGYRHNAKKQKRSWNISDRVFYKLMSSPCEYCGVEKSNKCSRRGNELFYNGLDRIDNEKGYTKNNVVSCCKTCNFAKRGMTNKMFIEYLKLAGAFQFNKGKNVNKF